MRMLAAPTLLLAALLVAPMTAPAALAQTMQASPDALDQAIASPIREKDKPRDVWRHPRLTLKFFEVEPGMTVVDYMPSGGWWTRILVPYLGPQGRYIGLNPAAAGLPERVGPRLANLGQVFPGQAAQWTDTPVDRIEAYNTDTFPSELVGTVDRVMIMREMHNMMAWGVADAELQAIHRMLKPNGLVGIEDHRARTSASDAEVTGTKGYIREGDVVALMERNGFMLVGASGHNNNPKDTADWEKGVWTLPPNYAAVEKIDEKEAAKKKNRKKVEAIAAEKAKYDAIGESDRFTLLFRPRPMD